MMAGGSKSGRESIPVNNLSKKQTSKKHDFLRKENPHPQRGRFSLLVCGFKMMSQSQIGCVRRVRQLAPPFSCIRTDLPSQSEFPGNFPLAAEKVSPILNPWLPTDWKRQLFRIASTKRSKSLE